MPLQLTLEPDQAERRAINLIREGTRNFVVEIDPTTPHLKDVVCVAVDAEFDERPNENYLRTRQVTKDEACQWAVNLIRAEMSFSVKPEVMQDGRTEFLVHVERRKR